jgi:hypothetical protein
MGTVLVQSMVCVCVCLQKRLKIFIQDNCTVYFSPVGQWKMEVFHEIHHLEIKESKYQHRRFLIQQNIIYILPISIVTMQRKYIILLLLLL